MGTWGCPAKALAQDTGTLWCPDLHVTLGTALLLWAWSPCLSVGWVAWRGGVLDDLRGPACPTPRPPGTGTNLLRAQGVPGPATWANLVSSDCLLPWNRRPHQPGPLCVPLQSHHVYRSHHPHCGLCGSQGLPRDTVCSAEVVTRSHRYKGHSGTKAGRSPSGWG